MSTKALRDQAAHLTRQFQDARRNPDLVILEGFHALKHALRFGANVKQVVSCDRDELGELLKDYAPDLVEDIASRAHITDRRVFRQLGPYEPHTGVVSIAKKTLNDPIDLLEEDRQAPLILLEDPRHRGNLGAVIRVAAAAEAAGVLATGQQDPWDPVVVRGSAGLHFAIPVAQLQELPGAHRGPLVALDPQGKEIAPKDIPSNSVLAFGSERTGLSNDLLQRAELCVRLPMRNGVSSLNLATSVAAVLYSIRVSG